MITFKNIKNNGKTFLLRFSKKCKTGSIKLHIILNDDVKPHTHPWDFKSVILLGAYEEITYDPPMTKIYNMFDVNEKKMNVSHLVRLRRFCGLPIPCITIGRYGEKKQLCSLCQELGYCKSQKK